MSSEKQQIPLTPVKALTLFFRQNFVRKNSSINSAGSGPTIVEVKDVADEDSQDLISNRSDEKSKTKNQKSIQDSNLNKKIPDSALLESNDVDHNEDVDDDDSDENDQDASIDWNFDPNVKVIKWTKKEIIIKTWNVLVVVGIPTAGVFLASVYYRKSKDFFQVYIPSQMRSTDTTAHPVTPENNPSPELWNHLRNLGEVTGYDALITNALVNLITGLKYVLLTLTIGNEYERAIYSHVVKSFRFWMEQILLYGIAACSTVAISVMTLQVEKKFDGLVDDSLGFSVLSGFFGMWMMYGSIKWLKNVITDYLRSIGMISPLTPQQQVNKAIMKYYSTLLSKIKNTFREQYGFKITRNVVISYADKPIDNSLWGALKPYLHPAPLIVSALLMLSRIGMVYLANDGAKMMSPTSKLGEIAITIVASLPPIFWGAKGFGVVNAALFAWFTGSASDDISPAQEVFPAERFLLMFYFLNVGIGSFASNSKICTEAAKAFGFAAAGTIVTAVLGGFGSVYVNLFAMIMLADTMIELFVLYFPAMVDEFKARYIQVLSILKTIIGYLDLVLRDQKAGIEYLIYNPEIIPEIKQIIHQDKAHTNQILQNAILDVGFVVEDIVRIEKEAGYTKDQMKNILRLVNFPKHLREEYDQKNTVKLLTSSKYTINSPLLTSSNATDSLTEFSSFNGDDKRKENEFSIVGKIR